MLRFAVGHLTERGPGVAQDTLAYLQREGQYQPRSEQTPLLPGDTVKHGDYVTEVPGNLPVWAEDSPLAFFDAAVAYERGGPQRPGRWASTWQLTLPHELSCEDQWLMAVAFLETHLVRHPFLGVMHDPVTEGLHQPHVHVVFSERTEDGLARTPAQWFRRPEGGGAGKDRELAARAFPEALRTAWADWLNFTYERLGLSERVHPGSLFRQGIARKPEPLTRWLSPLHPLQALRDDIRASRDIHQERAVAADAWEARKMLLGIDDVQAMDPETFLCGTYLRARSTTPAQALRDLESSEYALLVAKGRRLWIERRGLEAELGLQTRHLGRLGQSPPQEVVRGAGYRVRWQDDGRAMEREPQHGW